MTGEIAIILLTMIGSLGFFIFAKFGIPKIYEEEIKMLKQILGLKQKKPKEIRMLEQTIAEKQEELNHRNEIERLSEEIERLDEHLYPKEKESRREPLNDVYEDVRKYTVNPLRCMGVTTEEAIKKHNRTKRNLRRGTDRKPVKAPVPPMAKRGVTYEYSGPTKEEEEFYFGGNADE